MRPHYATEADWPDIKALLHASSLSVAGVQDRIGEYMVIRDNAGLLGCAGLERYENTGVLRGLAVAPRARSSGLGELLISAIVADVRRDGVESIVLQTSNASGYFERMGFTPISYAELAPAVLASAAMRRDQVEAGTLMQIAL
ncbi:GNAT family N-acetyltransferase [Cupriavidus consociatus]|uniref:GNAT family N-acetyltransferase n=1 Tax=Cupriavidus consociatus TaxID=2821357 RepID=UPI001AE5DDF9|nr:MULTISPECIES: GNAT family N-acetyltransferase [unclassified Cupriavidus]MBP0619351.1 GNAT family N-acetyltransferase [Cupriavidus sp. LEh25]MDK2655999.1 GNAT family N-acetyltransferase [Cupriavidus sp. LEh21]